MAGWCAMVRSIWGCSTRASFGCAYRSAALANGGLTMAHVERDPPLFAQGDNPPPRPHPATTTSYPHPSSTPKKCHPCARSKVAPMSPLVQTLACPTPHPPHPPPCFLPPVTTSTPNPKPSTR